MSAQLEPYVTLQPTQLPRATPASRPTAVILPLRRPDAPGAPLPEAVSAERLAPARGLMIGLALGAILWAAIFALAWAVFH